MSVIQLHNDSKKSPPTPSLIPKVVYSEQLLRLFDQLFPPLTPVPEGPRIHLTPEKELWFAVLYLAIQDFKDSMDDAIEWIRSDSHEVGSMNWVCDHLGIDADKLRRRILALPPSTPLAVLRCLVTMDDSARSKHLKSLLRHTTSNGDCIIWTGFVYRRTRSMLWDVNGVQVPARAAYAAIADKVWTPRGTHLTKACRSNMCIKHYKIIYNEKYM